MYMKHITNNLSFTFVFLPVVEIWPVVFFMNSLRICLRACSFPQPVDCSFCRQIFQIYSNAPSWGFIKNFAAKRINKLAGFSSCHIFEFWIIFPKQKTVRMTKCDFPVLFTRIISPTCRKGKLYLPKHANLVLRKDVTSGHPQHVLKWKIRIGQWSNTVLQYWHQIKVLEET